MILDRPVAIWLIMLFPAYKIMGTGANLSRAVDGTVSYSPLWLLFGVLSVGAGLWLAAEIWVNGTRMVLVSWINLSVAVAPYLLEILASLSRKENAAAAAMGSLLVFTGSIWLLVAWYLGRHSKRIAK